MSDDRADSAARLTGIRLLGRFTVETDAGALTDAQFYEVATTAGRWRCQCVVLASGACGTPQVPAAAEAVPSSVRSVTPAEYRNPDQLGDGGVLVVGAGATGIQLAQELARPGRSVTISAGEHVRTPRRYRGMDIMWWMELAGVLGERFDEVDDVERVRGLPSFQLVGSDRPASLDLNGLRRDGVRVVGKLAGIRDGIVQLSGSLRNVCKLADLKLGRLLDTIDESATVNGIDDEVPPPHRFEPTTVDESPRLQLDLNSGESRPSSGRPATAPTSPGSTYRSSTGRDGSAITEV